ncbi:MAG TPA: AAA family ATPase [Steroidobacteraceae bacterium]|jgi:general secretion pathway protein A
MYLQFFGLAEKPFAITPDPRYLYLSGRHADALAHLVYGINEAGGFIQLTGEVGTGKTTTIRSLLARAPKTAEIALILNPRLSATEFLRSLCEELGLGADDAGESENKNLVDLLNRYLLRAHSLGRRVVLVVDEAQNLAPDVLEQVRLLTNLETETQKLLQIILIGQPELRKLLAREDLRQIAQRITARFHLDPLSREETAAYVRHRLRVAGATTDIFTRGALREIYRVSGGIPRVINILCDRAMLGAYTQELHQVPGSLVRRAGAEVFGRDFLPGWIPAAATALAVVILTGSSLLLWHHAPAGLLSMTHRHSAVAGTAATTPKPVGATAQPGAAGTAAAGTDAAAPAAGTPAATAATGPASPAGATTTLAGLLSTYHDSTDGDDAFRQLMALWSTEYVPGKVDGCTQALSQGLRCLVQRGSFAQLRLLNRPAILMLSDDSGSPYQVVLRGLHDDMARLQIGANSATVGVAELARYWFGDFVLLWRPATRDVRDLSEGMRGAPVRHLREQLGRWRPDGNLGSGDAYDGDLTQAVEQFQRANRLTVDGVAGIETQVALDAALASPDSPLLEPRAMPTSAMRGS